MKNRNFTLFFRWSLLILILVPGKGLQAQVTSIPSDTVIAVEEHAPNKALLMSAIIPGAGQIYNKKYWKPPIIYGGFAACAYFIVTNNTRYQRYRKAYIQRADGDSTTIDAYVNLYTENNLIDLKNYYRRNRDLTIIITAAVYVLNLLDAYVDAHLFSFNVSDNLSLRVMPDYRIDSRDGNFTGLQLNLSFR